MILWVTLLVGMHVRSNTQLVAWSDDGSAALLETLSRGPEGGGARVFELVSATSRTRYEVANDMSPGGPRHPERISAAECGTQVKMLAGALAGFRGVEADPKSCHRTERDTIVRITKRHADEAKQSLLPAPPKGITLPKGAFSAYASRALVLIFSDNGDGASFHSAQRAHK